MWFRRRRPDLSVIVVVHNMAREAPRTLYSLSTTYQRHIAAEDYEVIVVDNGSTARVSPRRASCILPVTARRFIRMQSWSRWAGTWAATCKDGRWKPVTIN